MYLGVLHHSVPVHFDENPHVYDVSDAHALKFLYDVMLSVVLQPTNEKRVLVSMEIVPQRRVQLAFETVQLLLLFTTHHANLKYQFN